MEISLFTSVCYAETSEEQYTSATNCYQNLENNPERQKYRHNWLNCIQKFEAVYAEDPNNSLASSGMYRAAELYLNLYSVSAIPKDKAEGVDLLHRIIKRYPSSTDRDMAEKLLSSIESGKSGLKQKSQKSESPKNESQKNESQKNESQKNESQNKEKSDSFGNAYITDLRYWTTPDYTRIVINISDERKYLYQLLDENSSSKHPKRLYLDIKKSLIGKNLPSHTRINDDLLLQARAGQRTEDSVRVVVDIKSFGNYKIFSLQDPFRVIIDVWGDKFEKNVNSNGKAEPSSETVSQSEVTSDLTLKNTDLKDTKPTATSETSSESTLNVSIKRSIKRSTKINEPDTKTNSNSSESKSEIVPETIASKTIDSKTIDSKTIDSETIDSETIDSETNSKGTSHLPIKRSKKSETMVLSKATRKLLRESLGKDSQDSYSQDSSNLKQKDSSNLKQKDSSNLKQKDSSNLKSKDSSNLKQKESFNLKSKESSRTASKGTTRVLQIAPGSNVDRIKASSIAKQLALGVRTIVIDPGHGGRDPGASGYTKGIYEKDVVLSISKKLSRKIRDRLNCNVIMTRSSDTYLTLEERTAIANTRGADLFISLHCNASNDSSLVGIETYYLNLATDDRSINVAARENATSRKNISDLESILNDLMKNAKINESSRLSSVVQNNLYRGMAKHYSKIKSLGVKQAPFYVLLGASMPSILIETSFLSNPEECRRLTDSEYQNALCDAITDGIAKYIRETNPQRL